MLSPSNSEPGDSDSVLESQPGPSKRSAKKWKMKYKSKFSKEWTKTWPFIVALPIPFHVLYALGEYLSVPGSA